MNNKAIQILRGSKDFDPLDINNELLDGQPFYSKKNEQFYVGDKSKIEERYPQTGAPISYITRPAGAAWIKPGAGIGSFVSANFLNIKADGTIGTEFASPADYPEATGIESISFGMGNKVHSSRTIVIGADNEVISTDNHNSYNNAIFGSGNTIDKNDKGEVFSNCLIAGTNNYSKSNYSYLLGGNLKSNYNWKMALGFYNEDLPNTVFEIGNGFKPPEGDEQRSNAFSISLDGDAFIKNTLTIGSYNSDLEDTLFEIGNGNSDTPSNAFSVDKDGKAIIQEVLQVSESFYSDRYNLTFTSPSALTNGGGHKIPELEIHDFGVSIHNKTMVTMSLLDPELKDNNKNPAETASIRLYQPVNSVPKIEVSTYAIDITADTITAESLILAKKGSDTNTITLFPETQ